MVLPSLQTKIQPKSTLENLKMNKMAANTHMIRSALVQGIYLLYSKSNLLFIQFDKLNK